jgi:hypothetical protein
MDVRPLDHRIVTIPIHMSEATFRWALRPRQREQGCDLGWSGSIFKAFFASSCGCYWRARRRTRGSPAAKGGKQNVEETSDGVQSENEPKFQP